MTINNIAQNAMSPAMMRVASGRAINSAADNPAGAAIVEEMTAQIRGTDQGTRNTLDMQALTNTADGGLATISDGLNRIRELGVQAMNGTNTPANRELIQEEISQIADHIGAAVGDVQFNSINLLDGTMENANTASAADGTGAVFSIDGMAELAQAVATFNATGTFDFEAVDAVRDEVSTARSELGALHNRFDFTASANSISSLNLADSRSRIADADIAEETMRVEQEQAINQMQILLQQNEQDRLAEQGIPGLTR